MAASILRFVLALAALLPGAAVQLRGKPPADSKTVEGPDCGHVRQIISKWTKASKVGHLAGLARGAVSSAEAAADAATAAKTQAEEIGAAFKDAEGALPAAIASAVENAGGAATAATKAVTALETDLGTFKNSITETDFSGEKVKDADIVKLEDLTTDASKAAKTAREVAEATVKKAEEVRERLLKDSGTAGALAKKVLDSSSAALAEASEIGQKAGFAVKDGALLKGRADEALSGLKALLAKDESDQKPVLSAFIDDLDAKATGVSDGGANVTTANGKLETSTGALKTAVAAVKAVYTEVKNGAKAPATASADLTAAEAALDAVTQDLVNVKATAKTLMVRQAKLKAKVEEAEKKLPPPAMK